MDITHYRGENYLCLIDCDSSRFALWRQLPRSQGGTAVILYLQSIFCEGRAVEEILKNNENAFSSEENRKLFENWGLSAFSSGNGINERNYRTDKMSCKAHQTKKLNAARPNG